MSLFKIFLSQVRTLITVSFSFSKPYKSIRKFWILTRLFVTTLKKEFSSLASYIYDDRLLCSFLVPNEIGKFLLNPQF